MDGINIQTQNFNADNLKSPEKPKSHKGLIVAVAVVVVIIAGGAAYYLFSMKQSAPVMQPAAGPQTAPQVAGPQTPPPGPSDELSDISSDLNAMDLNALDSQTASDTASINSAL